MTALAGLGGLGHGKRIGLLWWDLSGVFCSFFGTIFHWTFMGFVQATTLCPKLQDIKNFGGFRGYVGSSFAEFHHGGSGESKLPVDCWDLFLYVIGHVGDFILYRNSSGSILERGVKWT